VLWLLSPLIYVVVRGAVKGGMTADKNGGVRTVVSAENAAETNQSLSEG
jgi:hypothetical protein